MSQHAPTAGEQTVVKELDGPKIVYHDEVAQHRSHAVRKRRSMVDHSRGAMYKPACLTRYKPDRGGFVILARSGHVPWWTMSQLKIQQAIEAVSHIKRMTGRSSECQQLHGNTTI